MRILLIHNSYQQKGGEDIVFENEYKLLVSKGNTVHSLLFSNDSIEGLTGKLETAFNLLYSRNSAKKLEKEILSFKPDIIHIHNFFPVASPSVFWIAQKHAIPVVATLHNYRLFCPKATNYRNGKICEDCNFKTFPINSIIHNCYRHSKLSAAGIGVMNATHKMIGTWKNKINAYIAPTNFVKSKFIHSSLGIPANKIYVKHHFVFDHGYDFEKQDYYLFVGRISEEKGIDLLLEAFQKNGKKLIVIGTGPMDEFVRSSSNKYKNIEFVGFKEHGFIIEKMKKAKALIFPSKWQETFGLTIIEALSTGTPVICSNLGGQQELIDDALTGLYFKSGEVEDLISKVDRIENNPSFLKSLSLNSRKSFEEKYSEKNNYTNLIKIYSSVINNQKVDN